MFLIDVADDGDIEIMRSTSSSWAWNTYQTAETEEELIIALLELGAEVDEIRESITITTVEPGWVPV